MSKFLLGQVLVSLVVYGIAIAFAWLVVSQLVRWFRRWHDGR
jgi:hypothetical protein